MWVEVSGMDYISSLLSSSQSFQCQTNLVHKLQLLPSTDESIGVDKATTHWSWVENHIPGNAHQNIPIISCVGETAHSDTEK